MEELAVKTKSYGKFMIGALVGAALGATAGILLAPRSGKRTRELIQEKGTEITNNIKKKFKKE